MKDVTIANIVEILYKQGSEGYLEAVSPNEHHIDWTDDSPLYQSQKLEDDVPGQGYTVVSQIVAYFNYLGKVFKI